MKKVKDRLLCCCLLHVMLPVVVGTAVYFLVRPDTYISRYIYQTVGILEPPIMVLGFLPKWARDFLGGHAADILWAYGLTHAVFLVLEKEIGRLLPVFLICVIFETCVEFMQMFPFAKGTFDWWDIFLEICATAIASLVIKRYWEEKK